MALISVGLTHENVELELLERLTVPEHQWAKVLRTLVAHRNISEAVFISTCLRTEVVAVVDRFHDALEEIVTTISSVSEVDRSEFEADLTIHFDRGVATHLFEVAAGLRSVVPGEFEVLGQLRRALDLATDEQTAASQLSALMTHSLVTGRRVRHETAIARGTTSFAHAAVAVALERVDAAPSGTVLVVGAGQLAAGIVKNVVSDDGWDAIIVANRTLSRAQEMVSSVADPRVRAVDLNALDSLVGVARVIFVAAEVPQPLITQEMVRRSTAPLLLVDLAVPRGVARDVEAVKDVTRIDIVSLRERVAHALGERHDAEIEAQAIVNTEVDRYLDEQRARGAASLVTALRGHFDTLASLEFERRSSDLARLDRRDQELVESLVRAVVAKIAHRPTTALKEAAGTDQGSRLAESVRALFDL